MGLRLADLRLTVSPDAQQMTGTWHNLTTGDDESITLNRLSGP